MTAKDVANRVLRWSELFKKAKYPPLGNEAAEGPKSKYTNFSLQHIMDKYNFLPSLMHKREFLLSLGTKNPELVKDAFWSDKHRYNVETELPTPGMTPEAKEDNKHP